jgi:phytoene dehydrogenase-like protein
MTARTDYDAVVVGAGPNGLAAAIMLARAGHSVCVFESAATVGGGMRTQSLTLPGFEHDVCSAVHPLAAGSPFFRSLPLADYGLEWIHPWAALAHPLADGSAVLLERSLEATASGLGPDAATYRRLMGPLVRDWDGIAHDILGPLRPPRHPVALARFGLHAIRSAAGLATGTFAGEQARALFAGIAAHGMLPLEQPPSAAFGLVLAIAGHAVGWPIPRGGSQRLADALATYLRALGGEIMTGREIRALDELPPARAVLCDVTPRQLLRLAGDRLPEPYRQRLRRFRYGPGVCKVDWALDGPIPWTAAVCARAATVHVGGTLAQIAASERDAWEGRTAQRPFVLVTQPSLFDTTRAPEGRHTAWAYCHVPHGSAVDMTARIEAQIERFAPGFGTRILARHTLTAPDLEHYNANYIGGDINGGVQDLWQLVTRPTIQPVPYATPVHGLYLCSSSTPPGGGVHGMCGYFAARWAMRTALAGKQRRVL